MPFVVSRATASADRDDIGRLAFDGGFADRAFFDRVPMFVRRTAHGRHRVATVFTDEVHDVCSVKRSTLAVRVPMTTTAQTQVEDTKEDVHDSPVSAARSQSCNLPDRALRVNGRDLRNTLAVQRSHFRPFSTGPCEKVFLPESKSFHVLSSFPANYRLVPFRAVAIA